GATARAAERARRLAALDAEIAAQQQQLERSEREKAEAGAGVAALEAWVAAVPSGRDLLSAWQRADLLLETEQREEGHNQRAQSAAQAARAETARLAEDLRRIATEHDLPPERTALD